MKIHIACKWPDHSWRILPRLARSLIVGTSWTLSESPDPKADLNYFIPYRHGAWRDCQTVRAALFTHWSGKRGSWPEAAEAMDLRLTWAEQYEKLLWPYGLTRRVTPCLDTEKFNLSPSPPQNSKPVIGVVGYAVGNRKGQHLVGKLANGRMARKLGFDIRAMGKGWPVPCEHFAYEYIHLFYHSLDVYLCTSLVEGVPYPPLEALACGVKVVIPSGVGIMDELPEGPGVRHFTAGSYPAMIRALQQAFDDDIDPAALRQHTTRFTHDAWIDDHKNAFEEVLRATS